MPAPVLSIITVCFNSEKTIQRTFDSIRSLKNKTKNIEYILIDGASTDSTLNLIESNLDIIDQHLSEPDQGIYDGMNKGAKLATGKHLLYINSDDWVNPKDLLQIIQKLEVSELDFIGCDVNIVNLEGKLIGKRKSNLKPLNFFSHSGMPCSHQGFIIKKDFFNKLSGFSLDFKIAGDYELILKALRESVQFENFPVNIAFYTLGGVSYGNRAQIENFQLQRKYISSVYAILFFLKETLSVSLQKFLPSWLVFKIKKIMSSDYGYIQKK